MRRGLILLTMATVAAGLVCAAGDNLLVNPGLERDTAGWRTWPRKGQPEFSLETSIGHGDLTSLRIGVSQKDVDGSWVQSLACKGGTAFDCGFWFRTDPPNSTVTLLVEFGSPQGYAGQHLQSYQANGNEWTHAESAFMSPPQAADMQFEVWVNLDNRGLGTAWFDDFTLQQSTRPAVSAFLEEPLFHVARPGARSVRVRLMQTNRSAAASTCSVELSSGDALLARRTGDLKDAMDVRLPLPRSQRDVAYTVSVKAVSNGNAVFECEDSVVLRSAQPSVDLGRNRDLLVEGKPFFPIGVYWATKEDLHELREAGFNCVHGWQYPNDAGRAFFAEAKRLGLRVVLEMSDTLRGHTDLASIQKRAEFFRDDPALLCYYPVDEPSPAGTDPTGMRQAYNLLKVTDPDHPVMYVQCNMAHLAMYLPACDILAVDPYGSPDLVQQWMAQANGVSQSRKPVWAVIGTFPWQGLPSYPDVPPPDYVRAAVYTALIGGAKGLLYFSYHFDNFTLKQSKLWSPIGRLNREVAAMVTSLLTCEPKPVRTSDSNVVAALFIHGQESLLLAANKSASESVQARLTLPKQRGEARGLFDDRVFHLDGSLTFSLGPYGTMALRLVPCSSRSKEKR